MKKTLFLAAAFLFGSMTMQSCEWLEDDGDDDEITDYWEDDEEQPSDPVTKYSEWTSAELSKANTAAKAAMSQTDRDIIFYCNLARLDGSKFAKTYAKDYLSGSSSYVTSLISDLAKCKNYDMLYPDQGLYNAAKAHGEDMKRNNFFDHDSYDGTDTFDRIRNYYSGFACNENIAAGNSGALDIVMQWLIDKNTSSLGHRKAILKSTTVAVGIYTTTHPEWRYCSVMDFGESLEDAM